MITAKINEATYEDFSVLDSADDPVAGIDTGEFSAFLYDPSGTLSALSVSFSELGDGHYRAAFTPDTAGTWYLVVYHDDYFSTGKSGTIQVANYDLNDLSMLVDVYDTEKGEWKIENSEMIFYRENGVELMRFTLYTDGDGNPTRRVPV